MQLKASTDPCPPAHRKRGPRLAEQACSLNQQGLDVDQAYQSPETYRFVQGWYRHQIEILQGHITTSTVFHGQETPQANSTWIFQSQYPQTLLNTLRGLLLKASLQFNSPLKTLQGPTSPIILKALIPTTPAPTLPQPLNPASLNRIPESPPASQCLCQGPTALPRL